MRYWLILCSLTALGQALPREHLQQWRQGETVALQGTLHHVQGIDVEDGMVWVSSVDAKAKKGYLSRFSQTTGKLLGQVEVQEGTRIHPGGIALDGDAVWVPVAEYHRNGATTIQRRDKATLALLGSFSVSDHIGCIAASGEELLGGNWDSRTLYVWDKTGKERSRTANPHSTSYQDLKWSDGVWLGSGLIGREEGAVDWLARGDYRLLRQVRVHRTDRGVRYTHEGMTYRGRKLYFLPEDDPSRLFVFEAPDGSRARD
jgi:hypothetical protein